MTSFVAPQKRHELKPAGAGSNDELVLLDQIQMEIR